MQKQGICWWTINCLTCFAGLIIKSKKNIFSYLEHFGNNLDAIAVDAILGTVILISVQLMKDRGKRREWKAFFISTKWSNSSSIFVSRSLVDWCSLDAFKRLTPFPNDLWANSTSAVRCIKIWKFATQSRVPNGSKLQLLLTNWR